jgi:type I restriction enzyme, S subunit
MSVAASIELQRIMAPRLGSVDPSAFPDEEFDLYSIPAFDQGEPEVCAGSAIGSAKQIVQPGDVLLSRIVPHIRRAWVVGEDRGRRIIASGEWIVFRGEAAEPEYLRHVLVSDPFHAEFMRTVSGVGGSLLRARPAYVARITIPLPPLPEQRRIAEILDKADALRAKRRAALAQLDTLTQSIFLDMFGDPATNPKGWPQVPIGDHASKIGSGATPRGGEEAYQATGITLIRSMNVRDGAFLRDGLAFIDDEQAAQLDGVVVEADDVLLNITGASVARVCRAPADVLPARVNQHVAIIRPTSTFNPPFLEQCLLSASVKERLLKIARAGATREAITKASIEQFRVIRPPREVQDLFAARVGTGERTHLQICSALAEMDSLFATLQHRAFRGEL